MRNIGTLHPTDFIPAPCDTTQTMLLDSTAQAMDWPSGSSAGTIVRLSGCSTAGVMLCFHVNLESTKAAIPSSGSSTQGTTGFGEMVVGQGSFQIPGGSTGWSAAALSSGYVMAEFWKKGG